MKRLNFNPKLVSSYETQWWIAHHEKNKEELAKNLVRQHVELFELSVDDAKRAVGYFFEAVKKHDQRKLEQAIDFVADYYRVLIASLESEADPIELAKNEILWWRLHDELEFVDDKSKLTNAFASLYSRLFGISYSKMAKIAQFKTTATHEHDLAESNGVDTKTAAIHWQKVQTLLENFYSALKSEVLSDS